MSLDVQPYLGALGTLVVGWVLDALPGIRVGTIEITAFTIASVFAAWVALKSASGANN